MKLEIGEIMILQTIVFPQNRIPETSDLYYRSSKPIEHLGKHSAKLPPGCSLSFFTYMNAFSAYKWGTYSTIETLSVQAFLSGKGTAKLIHRTHTQSRCVSEQEFSFESRSRIEFHIDQFPHEGFYYLELRSCKDASVTLHGSCFSARGNGSRTAKIAVATCTFCREAYITDNLSRIQREIFQNGDSQLRRHLQVYVIDNGRTLKPLQFGGRNMTLIPNPNTGGSGGFTRGLVEILHQKEAEGHTHALLMDDDIQLDTESLERTYAFLCHLKETYADSVVGGAMLRNDAPCILEEAGANWVGKLDSIGRGVNLGKPGSLFAYDALSNAEYQAWWYCCIPLSLIGLDNLPLPFFLHDDDIEYGLRNYKQVLQLNGICVWHDTFENKRPSSLEYYDVRNHLILNSIHDGRISLPRQILGQFKRSTAMILRMRYEDVLLNIRGIDDFLKGPRWWASQDIARLHQEITDSGYRYLPLPKHLSFERYWLDTSVPISSIRKMLCFLTVNGAFLPKKKQPAIIACGGNPFVLFRRKKAYLWDPAADKAIPVTFSLRTMLQMYGLLFLCFGRLMIQYPKVKRQYQAAYRNIGTEQFWKRHIESSI